jgi:hypothetical protein
MSLMKRVALGVRAVPSVVPAAQRCIAMERFSLVNTLSARGQASETTLGIGPKHMKIIAALFALLFLPQADDQTLALPPGAEGAYGRDEKMPGATQGE